MYQEIEETMDFTVETSMKKQHVGVKSVSVTIEALKQEEIDHDDENYHFINIEKFDAEGSHESYQIDDSEEDESAPADNSRSEGVGVLPEKSKIIYEKCYEKFMAWRASSNETSFSEKVLLTYFEELGSKFKASSLWSEYSMLKATLSVNNQADLSKYTSLHAFLKEKSEGYKSKKSKTFLPHEVKKFIDEAPDSQYLLYKVALIFGIIGGCRRHELKALQFKDVRDLDDAILVTIHHDKSKTSRNFTVTGKYYDICKEYIKLRPKSYSQPAFFLRFIRGQCREKNVGINTFGNMGKTIASYLNLPDPGMYTGHCFRRTAETILVSGGDIKADPRLALRRPKAV